MQHMSPLVIFTSLSFFIAEHLKKSFLLSALTFNSTPACKDFLKSNLPVELFLIKLRELVLPLQLLV